MSFAKVDAALDSNPKIRRAGREGREVFLFLLRRVQLLDVAGRLPLANVESWYLADQLMMTETEACHGVSRCVTAGLIELGADVCVRGWDDEWARRPMTDAERKARQRQRDMESRAVAPPVTPSHEAVVTKRDSHECHVGEERRGEETRGEEIGERASAPKAEPRPKARAVVMPDGWVPEVQTVPAGIDATAEFVQFRDHHAARASRFVDWNAAFRTWLRNAAKFAAGRGGGRAPAQTALEAQFARIAALEARERQEALAIDGEHP